LSERSQFRNSSASILLGWLPALAFVLGVSTGPIPVFAETLNEAALISLVKSQSPTLLAARAELAVVEAELVKAKMNPNPEVSVERESFSSGGENEDSLLLTLPLDFSPRQSAETHLAKAEIASAKAELARATRQVVLKTLSLFYQLIAEKEKAVIQERALERLKEAASVMTRRREEGTASGYEQARVEVEAEFSASRLREMRAKIHRLRGDLAFYLGLDPSSRFEGSLEPDPEIKVQAPSDLEEASTLRPSVSYLRNAGSESEKARVVSEDLWLPQIALTAGPRMRMAHETDYGYSAGLSVELPFFSSGQGIRAESAARTRRAQARARAAAKNARREVRRAEQSLVSALAEARKFDEATRERIERLERAAVSGYREGLRSLVELLDARRARASVDLRRLELSVAIKRAEIALRASRGDFE